MRPSRPFRSSWTAFAALILSTTACAGLEQAQSSDDSTGSSGSGDTAGMTSPTTAAADTTGGEADGEGDGESSTAAADGDATMGVVSATDSDSTSSSADTTDGGTTQTGNDDAGTTDTGTTASSEDTDGEDTNGEDTNGEDTNGEDTDGEETNGEDTGGNDCVPTGILTFDDATFDYYSTANNMVASSNAATVTLIPDDLEDAGAAVFYTQPLVPPYQVAFEYSVDDDDGGLLSLFNSADGVSVMVAKDVQPYENTAPPVAGGRGFIEDGSGYAVDFEIYAVRQISMRDGDGTSLTIPAFPTASTYTAGAWRQVVIDVSETGITVTYEGQLELAYFADIDTTYDRIGFGAGTGGADGEHRIRNVEILCP